MANYMSQVDEEMLLHSQMPEGGDEKKRSRRRRRKKKTNVDQESGEGGKRRLSEAQVKFLEMNFGEERKLESGRKAHLAAELGLDPKQVAVWFQNRRVRWKNKQLEDDYLNLKNHHHASLLDKCNLQNEVLKLKKQLSEAEEEITRLSSCMTEVCQAGGGGEGEGEGAGGSPSSSLTTINTFQQPTAHGHGHGLGLGDHFGVEGDDLIMYEYNALSNYLMDLGYLL